MPDRAIERLFSLFTSPDRAAAMTGDLVEEREAGGRLWFWLHAAGVTFALWCGAMTATPLRTLGLMATGCALLIAPLAGGAVAVGIFPGLMTPAMNWLGAATAAMGGAFATAAVLTGVARRFGVRASAACAVAGMAVVFFLMVALIPVALAQEREWTDPSPHTERFVTVDEGVRLEVLDWGGSGRPIVLLAGLGDTAHVFDELAPLLAARYRVIGITRRAHGRSSAPLGGYGFARLAEDVVRVIDTLGLDKPVVIGHSFAGEELHVLGARHPGKVGGLIYLDAAFNRGDDSDNAGYDAVARTLPAAPARGPADMASFAALRAYLQRMQGFAGPEAYLRARWVANPDGTIARMWAPDAPIRQAMTQAMQAAYKPYNPEPIRVPALAVYAAPKSPSDLMRPWYDAGDAALRERVEQLYGLQRARVDGHIKWFEAFAERRRVAEIAGAHHLFLSHPREVVQQIDGFMSAAP